MLNLYPPHRNNLLLAPLPALAIIPRARAPPRSVQIIIPRLLLLLRWAGVQVPAVEPVDAVRGHLGVVGRREGGRRVVGIRQALGAAAAGFAVFAEAGAEAGGEGGCEEGAHDREAAGDDAEADFDVDPDAQVDGRV